MKTSFNDIAPDYVKAEYAALGYKAAYPEDIYNMPSSDLQHVAEGVTGLLDTVYDRDRSRSASRSQDIVEAVGNGALHLFTLQDYQGNVIATGRIENAAPFAEAPVRFREIGGMAKHPTAPRGLARRLLEARYSWAGKRAGDFEYLIANTRVAREQAGRPHNGQTLRAMLHNSPAITTYASYAHYVGPVIEPFVNATAPLQANSWMEKFQGHTIHLPETNAAIELVAALQESVGCTPDIRFYPTENGGEQTASLYELSAPSEKNEAVYIATACSIRDGKSSSDVPSADSPPVSPGLGDRVIIETDVLSNPDASAATFKLLTRQGFVLIGWEASCLQYGRIAAIVVRPGLRNLETVLSEADLSPLSGLPATQRFIQNALGRTAPILLRDL